MSNMHKSVKMAFFLIGVMFLCLFIATAITIQHASSQPISVVESDYYEKGLNYEKSIQDLKDLKAEGYSFSGEMFSDDFTFKTGDNEIVMSFTKNGQEIPSAEVTLLLERSTTDKYNVPLKLINCSDASMKSETFRWAKVCVQDGKVSAGKFVGNLRIPGKGLWLITVKGQFAGEKESRTLKKTLNIDVVCCQDTGFAKRAELISVFHP